MNLEPFQRDGYQIFKNFLNAGRVQSLRELALNALDPLCPPVEYEADTGYPGAPVTREAKGGLTPRRLLAACARDPQWRALATDPELKVLLCGLLVDQPMVSQAHHNCIMTKHPGFSSKTLWHQDIRYWSFTRSELVSAWFALTEEHADNGGLWLIPGSHKVSITPERLDGKLFLRPEPDQNAALIASARSVRLAPGDLLLFHCRTFHAAGTNDTQDVKLSAVFTYHSAQNQPLANTRSSLSPSIAL